MCNIMKQWSLTSALFITVLAVFLFSLAISIEFEKVLNNRCLCLLSLAFMFYTFYEFHWKRRLLPPGPIPWLLAGNMPQVLLHSNNIDHLFLEWKQMYGGVFTFWMGPYPMVMVGDVDKMKLYFVRHADVFTGRWQNFITHTFMGGHNGIVQVQGEKWREQRRFTLHTLRNFGLGRSSMEHKILTQVDSLIHYLQTQIPNQSSIEVTKPVAVCISNIINNILFGKTFEHEDASFVQLQTMLDRQSSLVTCPIMGLYLTLPITVHIPWLNTSWLKLIQVRDSIWTFLEWQIQEHKVAFHPTQPVTDFTFTYLLEMHKRQVNQEDMGHFSEKQLKMVLLDLLFAGIETTVTTIKWGILLLCLNGDIQHKCQLELDGVDEFRVELKHRPQLNYFQATLWEIQRVANILPINLLRTCTQSIQLDSYHFPKDTMVLPQVSIIMNDPANFEHPHLFQPERFLNADTNSLKKLEAFCPSP